MLRPAVVFLRLAIPFGVILTLLTPPFQSPDEYLHFYRAWQIAEGHWVASQQQGDCYGYSRYFEDELCLGGELPQSVLTTVRQVSQEDLRFDSNQRQQPQDIVNLLPLPLSPENRLFLNFKTTALHSPIPYFPQAIGIAVGRVLHLSPLLLMYLGRLTNLAVWLLLLVGSIRLTPLNPWLLVGLALTPMSLFQAASLSVDVLTNGMAFLFVALVLRQGQPERTSDPLTLRDSLALAGLAIALSLAKLAYFPLTLLLFEIPRRRFGSWRRYILTIGGVILASLLAVGLWSAVVSQIYIPLHPQLSPPAQLAFILGHPLGFVATLGRTVQQQGGELARQFIGVLGWLDTPLPGFLIASYWGVLAWLALIPITAEGRLDWRHRGWLAIAALSSILVLCTLAYLWNFVGNPIIGGLQGRYFIPIAPLLGLLLYQRRWRRLPKLTPWLLVGYLLFSLTVTCLVVGDRYYG
ncbi:MAG: DUF2142 domain-containing protein [Phormidium sp. SL48-SHIP]|nr:MAG: DUF2142 domain-containing protein [Phormidium sp. SL48-SHIP]